MATKWQAIMRIQKFRRVAAYAGFYCFYGGLVYAYTNNSTRAGISRADQYYSSYPAGTELLSDVTKLYKAALGNVFEVEEWGPIEFSIMEKHFERQGKSPYAYHAKMGLWTFLEGILLLANSLAILNEDRFLAPRGWSFSAVPGTGGKSFKGQAIGLIYAIQYLRVPLVVLNAITIVVMLVSG